MKILAAKRKNRIKRTKAGFVFDCFNVVFIILLCLIMVYPLWYVLVLSLNTGSDAMAGPIWLWPREFTLENYKYVLSYPGIKTAAITTIGRCIVGPIISVMVCMMAAYALSKPNLPGKKAIILFLMGPMFIGGTVVSNYIVMAKLGLLNNFFVFVLPGAFGYFTAVIMRSFIDGIPIELQESATIDGAGHFRIFMSIIIPLSKACMAAFLFFSVVGNWLDLQTSILFITKRSLYTLQYILHLVMTSNEARNIIDVNSRNSAQIISSIQQTRMLPTPQVIKMAIMVVVTFPILLVYPFFQKYFVKGMLTGSVKS